METNRKILHIEESLERFGNDVDLYKEILIDFLQDQSFAQKAFEKSVNDKNYEELKQLTHKLKGFVGTIGAELLYEALKNFEILLKNQNLKETEEHFLKIQELYSITESEIQNFLSKNP